MLVRAFQLQIALVLILLLALAGCATAPGQGSQPQNLPPVGAPPTDPSAQPQTQPGGSGISIGDRAQSALEAMVMGAVLGLAQWVVIRRHVTNAYWWILASTFGMFFGASLAPDRLVGQGGVVIAGLGQITVSLLP